MLAFLFGPPGWGEMLLLGVVGLLIFGKRLPEVGKNLGRGIVEFKKGLSGVKEEIEQADPATTDPTNQPQQTKQIPPTNANTTDTQQAPPPHDHSTHQPPTNQP